MTLLQNRFDVQKMAELIDQAYINTRREPHDKPKKSFAPSSVGYGSGCCPRRWWYDFNGGTLREDEVTSSSVANMAYGTEAHERIQNLFEQAGILVEKEKKVIVDEDSDLPPVFGFADLIINWQGEEVVGEIKTTTQESFVSKSAKRQATGYHLVQVLLYMKILGLKKGFIIYENKNNQELLIIPVSWNINNKALIENVISWMDSVYDNFKNGELPIRPFKSRKSIACKSCYFVNHCWEDEDGSVDLPRLEIPK